MYASCITFQTPKAASLLVGHDSAQLIEVLLRKCTIRAAGIRELQGTYGGSGSMRSTSPVSLAIMIHQVPENREYQTSIVVSHAASYGD